MTDERAIKEGALQARRDPSPTPPGQGAGTPTNPLTGRPVVTMSEDRDLEAHAAEARDDLAAAIENVERAANHLAVAAAQLRRVAGSSVVECDG